MAKMRWGWLLIALAAATLIGMPFRQVMAQANDEPSLKERLQALEEWKAEQEKSGKSNELTVYWKDGIRMKTDDGAFKLKLGGRVYNDWAFYSQDKESKQVIGDIPDGVEIRAARLYVAGTIYERVGFKGQYDFAGGKVGLKDVYIEIKSLPAVGNYKVGHFKEPFGLEENTSSKYNPFMERGLPAAFAPSRNVGMMLHDSELKGHRLTWALGVFRDVGSSGKKSQDGDYDITGRITGLPYYEDKGKKLVHIGAAASYRTPTDQEVSWSSHPESHLALKMADTGDLMAENVFLIGGELAGVYNSFSAQGEVMFADVSAANNMQDTSFWGAYGFVSYFITGENRKYKNKAGTFSRVKPKENFLKDGGSGAWEVALRGSMIDLEDEDAGVYGGVLTDVTGGVNWYLNPNTRILTNYVYSQRDTDEVGVPTVEAHIAQMRFQLDF